MKKSKIITTGIFLSVLGFGAFAANAQNTNPDNDADVVIIEEEGFVAEPVTTTNGGNRWNDQADATNASDRVNKDTMRDRADKVRNDLKNDYDARRSDLSDINDNVRVNNRPDNQPTVDKALKNQNPTYNN